MKINITGLDKWKKYEHQSYIKTVALKLEEVTESLKWQKEIEEARYSQNNGHDGKSILKMILSGADDMAKNPDGDIDLDCYEFHQLSNTVAYTYLGDYRTFLNTYFLNIRMKSGVRGEAQLSNTIMHELMHRAFRFTHSQPYNQTVPYKIGSITEKHYYERFRAALAIRIGA